MKRVKFTLTMPGRGSWDGGWSGSERNYIIMRSLPQSTIEWLQLANGGSRRWSYNFRDGWRASIEAHVLPPRIKAKKSDGFCGYDWMVDSIIAYDDIHVPVRSSP